MKKKAVALAVGTLFAAPAAHAQITLGNETIGTVQIYGKIYPEYGTTKGQGSTWHGWRSGRKRIRWGGDSSAFANV